MGIPGLTKDGILPRGMHRATPEEVRWAFGWASPRRAKLMAALEEAVGWVKKAGVKRILVDGSFVTAKKEPQDVDLVFLVSQEFNNLMERGDLYVRWVIDEARKERPKLLDIFLAVEEEDWASWVRFFEGDALHGRKGLVEVVP